MRVAVAWVKVPGVRTDDACDQNRCHLLRALSGEGNRPAASSRSRRRAFWLRRFTFKVKSQNSLQQSQNGLPRRVARYRVRHPATQRRGAGWLEKGSFELFSGHAAKRSANCAWYSRTSSAYRAVCWAMAVTTINRFLLLCDSSSRISRIFSSRRFCSLISICVPIQWYTAPFESRRGTTRVRNGRYRPSFPH